VVTADVLGTRLPPFLMSWEPRVDPLVAVSAAVAGGGVVAAPSLVWRTRSRVTFASGLYVLALALGLSINVARTGPGGWWKVFATGARGSSEGHSEYLPSLVLLHHGIGFYIGHFASLEPYLTTHVKGNPPGPLVALALVGIRSPTGLAALCIGLGALSAPLTYDLARAFSGDEIRARIAGVLSAFIPATLLFGVTSVDYAFLTLGLIIACLLVRPGTGALLTGSMAVAIASFFSWLLLAIPAWAAIVAVRRGGWGRALAICAGAAAAVVVFDGVLGALYGYDPVAVLRATDRAYRHGIAASRPYAFWVFGSPAAWAVMLGPPVAWLTLRGLAKGEPAAVAVCSIVAVASVMGFTKAETERIWLPFVPLACVAAALALPTAAVGNGRLRLLLGGLAAQALAVELLFFTVW
jgi:methylthioxylose transferase